MELIMINCCCQSCVPTVCRKVSFLSLGMLNKSCCKKFKSPIKEKLPKFCPVGCLLKHYMNLYKPIVSPEIYLLDLIMEKK